MLGVVRRRLYSNYVPIVVERSDRIVCLHSAINPAVASSVIAQLLFLESQDNTKPIHLYINSPGGHVTDGFAIYDTMQGQASDIAIHAQEILKTRRRLNETIAMHSKQPLDKIERIMERDYYMTAQEAVEFGLIDKVIEKSE
ncbi:ATP-dependent Clp protease proteolytic subunit [Paramicrosporidium saccamoebae]|uniref:ATP-dependent Clp protease proteolytic subunit n=1 Tax=Paramicrosporidium saccamoebae TaxID=1246581 RepID=A0A2H9TKJ9_9FUNG|nr:ATP-dependent Clp protease proteolytic subunit [Paramicrosporidium saccamoebae]